MDRAARLRRRPCARVEPQVRSMKAWGSYLNIASQSWDGCPGAPISNLLFLSYQLVGLARCEGLVSDVVGSTHVCFAEKAPAGQKVAYDFSGENLHWEGSPAVGDLALNILLGTTL